jgi:hypothetical protein
VGTKLEITVSGRWLSMESFLGAVEMSTVWPGGSDEVSWTPAVTPVRRFSGGESVVVYYGGVPVWAGKLTEPDPSQAQLTAIGAWREGADFAGLDNLGAANKVPDTVVDQAIIRGLNWTRPTSLQNSTVGIDITQGPVSVATLLDTMASGQSSRWGVDPLRQVYKADDPTTPSFQTLPIAGGFGYALDNYASTLIGRYLDSVSSTYKTETVTDTTAESLHGHVERIIDLTPRGGRTAAQANSILTNMLAKDRSIPQWTQPIEVVYGELLNMGGVPVALETVAAGEMLRVNGGFELTQRRNGLMYVDMVIGRTQLANGTLTISPIQMASRSLLDTLTTALA